ncbi:hypothetical protein GGR52DRAFT_585317 [Hypoxylon sp. FL1284]|nr:hypothetical protein GGR52DRAFT_585317 [Hypoxylon sp. FL1284]
MGYKHRDNAQFGRAKWRKTLLLPCWVAQIVLLLALIGLFSSRLSNTVKMSKKEKDHENVPPIEVAWEVVNITLSFVSLIVTFVSIARFIAEVLTPLPFLFSSIANLVLATVALIFDIVVYVQHADRNYSMAGLGMDVVLMFFTMIPAIYAIIVYRRLLTYDDYHIPGNVKPYGYASTEEPEENAYRRSLSWNSSWREQPTSYDPTGTTSNGTESLTPRPLSLTSVAGRRISFPLSRGTSPQPSPPLPADPQQPPAMAERRASYDHRRSTQFDEYVEQERRRRSGSGARFSRDDVERALGAEFGWGAGGDEHSGSYNSKRSSYGNSDNRDSVVSAGSVAAPRQARPRGDSLPQRQVSLEASIVGGAASTGDSSSVGATTSTAAAAIPAALVPGGGSSLEAPRPAPMARAHSLNSVPEAHEEEDGGGNGDLGLERRRDEDEALLGVDSRGVSRSSSGASSRSSRRLEPVEGLEDVELGGRKRRRDL